MRCTALCAALALVLAASVAAPAHANSLDRRVVEAPINARRTDLVRCFDAALERNPHAKSGRIVTQYRIARDGRVEAAEVTTNEFDDPRFGECVVSVFRSIRYPAMPQVVNIHYPLQFNAAD